MTDQAHRDTAVPYVASRADELTRAFHLIHDIQASVDGAAEALDALEFHAFRSGWDEVVRAAVFGRAVVAWLAGDPSVGAVVEELIDRSRTDGDLTMTALGLALRSDQGFAGVAREAVDDDLAQAIILLESATGGPLERISGHTACAIALGNRWLFELSREQYALALAIGEGHPAGSLDFILAPIMFNSAEELVSWAAILRQLGDTAGVAERWSRWQEAAKATGRFTMAEAWVIELEALGVLLAAIAGNDTAATARSMLDDPKVTAAGRSAGILALALALANYDAGRGGVALEVEVAVSGLGPDVHPHLHDLALFLAATVEAERGSTAGLRFAKRQLAEHWTKRGASLAAMATRLESERLAAERDVLSRHARLDDLTGIGNRRALEQLVDDLIRRDVEHVALVLFDVDAFKGVNDRHGHLAGDAVLVRIARALEAGVGEDDLAVRLGGDEFAVVFGGTTHTAAIARAEEIFADIDAITFADVSDGLVVTVSAGVSGGTAHEMTAIQRAADAALYRAKAAGGHTVIATER